MNSLQNITPKIKNNFKILLVCIIILSFLIGNFFIFQPNVPMDKDTYWYISVARNFALHNKLENNLYDAKSVIYDGKFPGGSFWTNVYPFFWGLFLKIFKGNALFTFTFNYFIFILLLYLIFLISRNYLTLNLSLLNVVIFACLPVIIKYLNILRPEIFYIFLITLIYFLYIKNREKFNYIHFIILTVSSLSVVARSSNLIFVIFVLFLIYFNWGRERKIWHILLSLIFFIAVTVLFNYLFSKGMYAWWVNPDYTIYHYISRNGLQSVFNKEFLSVAINIIKRNYYSFRDSMFRFNLELFFFYWVSAIIIIFNFISAFINKNKKLRKDMLLFLIPEILLIIVTIIFYDARVRMVFCFIPFNIIFLILYIKDLKISWKIISIFLITGLIIMDSYITFPYVYITKQYNSSIFLKNEINKVVSVIKKQKNSSPFVLAGDVDMMQEYVVCSNNNDKYIRISFFQLNEQEFKELSSKDYIDFWILHEHDFVFSNDYDKHLKNWPNIEEIVSANGDKWILFSKKSY